MPTKIAIGSDHAGYEYKQILVDYLNGEGYQVYDVGPFSADSVDYPDFIHPVANRVGSREADMGIILCGSGNGAAITANKHKEIRAAIAWNEELSSLARQHNNANILAIPARFVNKELAVSMVDVFLQTAFEGGRHQRRVDKMISCM